jgi:hypothetical protein
VDADNGLGMNVLNLTSEELSAEARRLEEVARKLRALMHAQKRAERRQREREECLTILADMRAENGQSRGGRGEPRQ